MTLTDVLMVFAVFLAPFFAIFAQRAIERWKERRDRRLWVFKALMASRGAALSQQHVQALNMIELEFNAPQDEAIRRAWRVYHDHLNSFPQDVGEAPEKGAVWSQKGNELLDAMLDVMGRALGYDFDRVAIRKGAYSPKGHADAEMELQVIRRLLAELLAGDRSLRVSSVPQDEEAAKTAEHFRKSMFAILDGRKPLQVLVQSKDAEQADAADGPSGRR